MSAALLEVAWPAPPGVGAFSSTRRGGVSSGPFSTLNLSTATGDAERAVRENVRRLARAARLPQLPRWPRQVHGTDVVEATTAGGARAEADAVFTTRPGLVCSVRTADCLPVLLCDRDATCVAAAHAGWRGLAAGVLEATVAALPAAPDRLLAWLGPGIGAAAYEVGGEVRDAFLDADPGAAACLVPSVRGRWLADLAALARRRLEHAGVASVHASGLCTFGDPLRFFSHRRDGPVTGRLASGVWLAGDA